MCVCVVLMHAGKYMLHLLTEKQTGNSMIADSVVTLASGQSGHEYLIQ